MNTRPDFKIEIWDADEPRRPIVRSERRHWPPAISGLVGSILIHSMLLPAAFVGIGATTTRTQQSGSPSPELTAQTEDLVLIDLPPPKNRGRSNDIDFPSPQIMAAVAPAVSIETVRVEIPSDPADERTAPQVVSSSDEAEASRERLAGIYNGQIRARIERVWRRPRTPVNGAVDAARKSADESFQCLVTIVQDAAGQVQETQLLSCNGSIEWQHSLVRAINQASPLPAPPDPKIFTRAVTLNLIGIAFGPGAESDEYEIPTDPTTLARLPPR